MEGEVEIGKKSFISSTNWTILNGSLDDSISFETPISSINEDFHDSKSLKHPSAVLTSSSSESAPCEIKLSFEQRHEIRQVYVRSSARIYEIYYETGPESNNEYLCTVRCGIATNDSEETSFEQPQNDFIEDKVKSDSSGSSTNTDEDGWVEVKVSETCNNPPQGRIQEFYEATAEISDSNPCTSVTLRLLSLETKGCVHVQEIYIFGDPIEINDSDDKTDPKKNSVMAMLVPTLLQLSKTKTTTTQEAQPKKEEEVPGDRMERVLDELVSRVGRMEAFCLRFEEKMLKPISNIETRLERLEKQLEVVLSCDGSRFKPTESQDHEYNENQESESESESNQEKNDAPPGLIIRAPEFSNEEDDDGHFEDNEECLIIRGPEFSNEQDEEEGNDGHFEEQGSKPCLSIDDALSMALAGFISSSSSSSSSQPPQIINHSWVVKAPEYNDTSASPPLVQVGPTATPAWEVDYDSDPDISLGNQDDLIRPPPHPHSDEVESLLIQGQKSNLTVDFELPVLDVKFDLSNNSGYSLEKLLSDDVLIDMKEEENNQDDHLPLEDSVFEIPVIEVENVKTDIPVIEIPDSP